MSDQKKEIKKIIFNKNNKESDNLIKRLPFTIKCFGKLVYDKIKN